MRWYGYSNLVKTKWHNQLSSSSELAYNWKKLDIRTLVLKGFSFALYYPNPSSRPASDLDCYLCGRYEDGNRQVEEMGIEVHREDYRHSTFQYNFVHVENHKICTTVRGKRQRKVFERYLRVLLETKPTQKQYGSELEKPCLMFNSLYFLQHAHRHFLREGFQLRYICDWAMLVKAMSEDSSFDLDEFWIQCKMNDLKPFAESMSRLANYVCGVKAPWLDDTLKLQKQDELLLCDCYNLSKNAIKYGNNFYAHFQMVKNMFRQRWKYKYFSQETFLHDAIVSAWCVFFEIEPNV